MNNPLNKWLTTDYIGRNVLFLDSVDSTNNYARELLRNLPENGTVIIAKEQSLGRGQFDRKWFSPNGGLYYSCIVDSVCVDRISLLTLACGIACHDTILSITNINTNLKWINDIEFNNKKLGGILVESKIRGDKISLIIGVGLNINIPKSEIPIEIDKTSTSILEITNQIHDLNFFAANLSNAIEKYLKMYNAKEYNIIKGLWLKNSKSLGRKVEFNNNGEVETGIVLDINEFGSLQIQSYKGNLYTFTNNLNLKYLN